MASVFKRGRWVDATGRKCRKTDPGARWAESRFYTVQVVVNGKVKLVKGYTDKAASEQLGAKLERAKARGEEGLVDPYKEHKARSLSEHVADWIAELRQLGRDDAYIAPCKARLERLMKECDWSVLTDINADSFYRWRENPMSDAGHNAKSAKTKRPVPMGARTKNHYLEALRAFCQWCVKRKRWPVNLVADVQKVDQTQDVRRARRALNEDELVRLLDVVPEHHQLPYRTILATGLRRDELQQLRWGDIHLDAPMPFIQLRAATTKAKRADVLPIRTELVERLRQARGEATDNERVCPDVPSMYEHRRYLKAAGIPWEDDAGRRADFHAMRHTFGTLLSKVGVAPRVAMALMRHTDIKLTMNCYTDPRILDLSGAVERLPALGGSEQQPYRATGSAGVANPVSTSQDDSGRSKSVSSPSTVIGICSAAIGQCSGNGDKSLTPVNAEVAQKESPSGEDGRSSRRWELNP